MTDSIRDLLHSVADRAATYLETQDERGVAPTEAAVQRLSELDEALPDAPTAPEKVLAILDEIGSPATVTYTAGTADAAHSTLSASPASITADGVSTSTITVQARDINDNNIFTGDRKSVV